MLKEIVQVLELQTRCLGMIWVKGIAWKEGKEGEGRPFPHSCMEG